MNKIASLVHGVIPVAGLAEIVYDYFDETKNNYRAVIKQYHSLFSCDDDDLDPNPVLCNYRDYHAFTLKWIDFYIWNLERNKALLQSDYRDVICDRVRCETMLLFDTCQIVAEYIV
jgi:hypothetical protein